MKLEEITDKLYAEGVEKGNAEAKVIVAKAEEKAAVIVAEAERKAQECLAKAEQKAAEDAEKEHPDQSARNSQMRRTLFEAHQ